MLVAVAICMVFAANQRKVKASFTASATHASTRREKACENSSEQPKRPSFGGVLQQGAPKKSKAAAARASRKRLTFGQKLDVLMLLDQKV